MVERIDRVNRVLHLNPAIYTDKASILNKARNPHKTTEKYAETDDLSVVETFNAHGWYVQDYRELKPRRKNSSNQGFQKYLAIYESKDNTFSTPEGRARLLQIGSHDGTTPLIINAGFIRFACLNGLICSDDIFEPLSIKHLGSIPQQVDEVMNSFARSVPFVFGKIRDMSERILSTTEQLDFAKRAAAMRFKADNTVDLNDVLYVRRDEDKSPTLWTVFNRIQENLLNPYDGFKVLTAKNKARKVRSVNNITTTVTFNKGLWHLANTYLV